jgi:hypothetical protein
VPRLGQEKATPARRAEFIERLRALGPGEACVTWPWSETEDYSRVRINGVKMLAHRWVYEQIWGVSLPRSSEKGPGDVVVMHRCDNPTCVRPSHLILGTPATNTRGAVEKGRMRGNPHPAHRNAPGTATGKGKISEADAAMIRKRVADGETQSSVARAYGVSDATISHVVRSQTHTGEQHGNRRLSDRQYNEIRRLVLFGAKKSDVARSYGVTPTTIGRIVAAKPR